MSVKAVRAREYGLSFGYLAPGANNCIADVSGLMVGSVTLCRGDGDGAVRTGVTAVVPHPGNLYEEKVIAAVHVINGHGKPTGFAQIAELGVLETPIVLTSTLSVGDAFRGLVLDGFRRNPSLRSLNPVVLECNDALLTDSRSMAVTAEHVLAAIDQAVSGPVPEGNVGAGTGMSSFGWKSGIGTASRVIECAGHPGTLGVLVLSNFGYPSDLVVCGCPVGHALNSPITPDRCAGAGSLIVVGATDFALDARQLGRLARRVQSGVARVGGYIGHTSGEFVVAMAVAEPNPRERLLLERDDDNLDVLFHAMVDATEEAIVNSLFCASTTTGVAGTVVPQLPVERVVELVSAHLAICEQHDESSEPGRRQK
jgi:D-aminopeptidase